MGRSTRPGVDNGVIVRTIVLMLTLGCFSGCGGASGPQRSALSGSVTLDGMPVAEGTIRFVPSGAQGGPTTGGTIENGKYSIPADKGAVPGEHKVEISWMKKTGKQIPVAPPATSPTGMVDEVSEAIPKQYNAETTLSKKVQPGPNVFDFPLTSK